MFIKSTVLAGIAALSFAETAIASCEETGGNWYCDEVRAISYSNFGVAGQYQKVASMDNGKCSMAEQKFTGGMAPLDGEISWHFRGPLHLKQFAFYTPGSSPAKRSVQPTPAERRQHGHKHLHQEKKSSNEAQVQRLTEQKRGLGDVVTATINGQVVSWVNDFVGGTAPTAAPASAAENAKAANAPAPSMNAGAGNWGRQGYYNAVEQVSDGLTFLNNMGGQGSGIFDYVWGLSLSYASSDAKNGQAYPGALADKMLDDNTEVIIMTDKACNGDCGAVRPGTVAYHGFNGPTKLFLIEFSMPNTGTKGFNMDMPAAWVLNAEIPRTLQYGDCSCWKSGCGEWDIFEVLTPGEQRCKSTFHGGPTYSLGDSNWFKRPADKYQKAAVVFDGQDSTGHIVLLDDNTNFDDVVSDEVVASWLNEIPANQRIGIKLPS